MIAFEELPFHIGVADAPTNGAFPDVLPFSAGLWPDFGLLIQSPEPKVVAELDRVYRRGSMLGTPLSAEGLGRAYADDFLRFVRDALPDGLEGRAVLEIGCGSGYLLRRLREVGADVLGIEPGPQGRTGSVEHGVPIIQASFLGPDQFGPRRFDLILHHCVLEHVPDPVTFLRGQRRLLTPTGRVIVGVPNEEPYLVSGDISTLVHEHWSFFTAESLSVMLAASGLSPVRVEDAGFGGAMYAVAERSAARSPGHDGGSASRFGIVARAKLHTLAMFFADMHVMGRTVGMWPGARALNYLHVLRPAMRVRLFDDDPRLTGKYYAPIPFPVEARPQIVERPVDELIILSRAFGSRLRSELRAIPALSRTTIRLLDEIRGS